jgi:hypothetical protein
MYPESCSLVDLNDHVCFRVDKSWKVAVFVLRIGGRHDGLGCRGRECEGYVDKENSFLILSVIEVWLCALPVAVCVCAWILGPGACWYPFA